MDSPSTPLTPAEQAYHDWRDGRYLGADMKAGFFAGYDAAGASLDEVWRAERLVIVEEYLGTVDNAPGPAVINTTEAAVNFAVVLGIRALDPAGEFALTEIIFAEESLIAVGTLAEIMARAAGRTL